MDQYRTRQIPETDWKRWRKLSEVALERFCARGLREAATFAEGPDSAHSRYRKLFVHMRTYDQKVGAVFNDQRRSNAFQQIAAAVSNGAIERNELAGFSEETQAVVRLLLGEG